MQSFISSPGRKIAIGATIANIRRSFTSTARIPTHASANHRAAEP
jgi:hypothetical protein